MGDSQGELKEYGFRKVGAWTLQNGQLKPEYEDDQLVDERVIYAYVADRKVKYIGICQADETTLRKRLSKHKWNKKTKKLKSVKYLRDALKEKQRVAIYAWYPAKKRIYEKLQIDLIKGLESPLICRFKTVKNGWNRHEG